MLPPEQFPQVCLAGRRVSNDWALIQALKPGHSVTLVERVETLTEGLLLDTVRVLVLDCTERRAEVLGMLPLLKAQHPLLCMLLVDGELNQKQVASAFREGIRDYFPVPYDTHLLAERVSSLCGRPP